MQVVRLAWRLKNNESLLRNVNYVQVYQGVQARFGRACDVARADDGYGREHVPR